MRGLAGTVGVTVACRAFVLSRSSYYRAAQSRGADADVEARPRVEAAARRPHPRALSTEQCSRILDVMSSERFIDRSPAHAVAALLDEGEYLASERTFYRVLGADAPVRERRNQRRHPVYAAPELLATGPNQVWSWDISVPQQAA